VALRFDKPWYLFRPDQILRRRDPEGDGRHTVRLAWGAEMQVPAGDIVGRAILRTGVYDLAVGEALWRLADPGESALDVGGNLGYMTGVMATRLGPTGHVHVFEPNPDVLPLLRANAAAWDTDPSRARVHVHPVALSSVNGDATLAPPSEHGNLGTASMSADGRGATIPTERLDDAIRGSFGVMKIDVEGHELDVLRGGEDTIRSGRVRDIVFEDHHASTSPVRDLLRGWGFDITRMDRTLTGPLMSAESAAPRPGYDAPSFLATRDPERARRRLAPRGWRTLRPRR
jgi:FkbM family methyltransferase